MIKRGTPFALVALLSACAMPIETYVSSIGEKDVQLSGYQLGADVQSTEGVMARDSVVSKLKALGIAPSATASFRLDTTFSALPAALKMRVGDAKPLAAGKAKTHIPRASKKCEPVEYRLGLALTNVSTGSISYRSSAAEYHCKGNAEAVIAILSDAVLKDIGSPKGTYAVERRPQR